MCGFVFRRVACRKYVRVALYLPGGQGLTLRGGALSREHHTSSGLPAVGPGCPTAQHKPALQGAKGMHHCRWHRKKYRYIFSLASAAVLPSALCTSESSCWAQKLTYLSGISITVISHMCICVSSFAPCSYTTWPRRLPWVNW